MITKIAISLILLLSYILWFTGFLASPVGNKQKALEQQYLEKILTTKAPRYKEEKELAQAYWLRYPGVQKDLYFGKSGPKGVWGAREHYELYGKKEGRIWGLLTEQETKDLL